jgi:uncharacterized protein YbjT (DUF2867 family)
VIVVTAAAGQTGTAVVRALRAQGATALFAEARRAGEAAAVLPTEDGLDGGTFEVAGPEPLTAPRLAELMGEALGREVVADDVIPAGDVPVSYRARCRRLMLDHYRAHGFAGSSLVATALLGRAPRSYADHLADLLGPA